MTDPEPKLRELGALLRAARVEAGLSQQQLGDAIGATRQGISTYERGRIRPSRRRLGRLGQLLELELEPNDWLPERAQRRPYGSWAGVTCSVEGCERPVDSLGLCTKHYLAQGEARNLDRAATACPTPPRSPGPAPG